MVGNKLGISYGEFPETTLVVIDRRKIGGDEGSGPVLSGGYCEGARGRNL